jgi:hypothetical protein
MRHSTLCGGDIRLEFFPGKGIACATVSVDGDLEDSPAAHCDPDNLVGVLHGLHYHLAGPGWLCSISRQGDQVELDLWRDGSARKRCLVSVADYEKAVDIAFGSRNRAYAA